MAPFKAHIMSPLVMMVSWITGISSSNINLLYSLVSQVMLGCASCQSYSDMESFLGFPPQPPSIPSLLDTDCGDESCDWNDPPPQGILFMPPPPIPPSMRYLFTNSTDPLTDPESCNLCHTFGVNDAKTIIPSDGDNEFLLPRQTEKTTNPNSLSHDSFYSVVGASALGLTLAAILLVLIFCKNGRFFRVKDSCPILPDSFLSGGHKTQSHPPSPTNSIISPVVNEKVPQSIINDTTKKTSIPSKYWRRGGDFTSQSGADSSSSGGHMMGMGVMDSPGHTDHYTDGSITSSPVYAELDGQPLNNLHLLNHHHSLHHHLSSGSVLVSGPSQPISPYAVGLHTYSEDSYDNAAYLASMNGDHSMATNHLMLHHRSLRRPGPRLNGLSSAAPLLSNSSSFSSSPQPQIPAYFTAGRPNGVHKPQQNHLVHQLARNSLSRMQDELNAMEGGNAPLARYTTRRNGGGGGSQPLYMDLPMNGPSISTFKSANPYGSYNTRDSKRPLPPVPGVRL